jgi:hypothetical protein
LAESFPSLWGEGSADRRDHQAAGSLGHRQEADMFEWIFDIPLVITGPAIILSLCLFAVGGLTVVRRRVLPRLRTGGEEAELKGSVVHAVMVLYGLAVALIMVSVWETYSDVSKTVSEEATSLAALYRDVSSYPEPIRFDLQKELRDYTDQVIRGAWPVQRRGHVPTAGVEHMNRFQAVLDRFEPATEGQKILHAETLRAFNLTIQARRLRLDAVGTGLPAVMWIVIIVGAFISLSTFFFFKVEDARLHAILASLLAIFMGLAIFLILSLDRPFRGDLGITPEPYQLIYDHLMKE